MQTRQFWTRMYEGGTSCWVQTGGGWASAPAAGDLEVFSSHYVTVCAGMTLFHFCSKHGKAAKPTVSSTRVAKVMPQAAVANSAKAVTILILSKKKSVLDHFLQSARPPAPALKFMLTILMIFVSLKSVTHLFIVFWLHLCHNSILRGICSAKKLWL